MKFLISFVLALFAMFALSTAAPQIAENVAFPMLDIVAEVLGTCTDDACANMCTQAGYSDGFCHKNQCYCVQ